ncbi:MAG: tryptophan synthase subunit alpha [Veillonellales bacterium]
MSRITENFQGIIEQQRKGLIIYLTAGCPDYAATLAAVRAAEQAGADLIEIGMPFSDPMADGPMIQKASTIALQGGATTEKTRRLIEKIRQESSIPLVVMTYINTILHFGVEHFTQAFAAAGIDGIIVPDLPAEEAAILEQPCRQADIDLIQFLAPTTTDERVAAICRQAGGFIYCVSHTGVTGVQQVDYSQIAAVMAKARRQTQVPLAIGFGIGDGKTACQAAEYADGVIIGSAVMQRLMEQGVDAVRQFVASLRSALDERQ